MKQKGSWFHYLLLFSVISNSLSFEVGCNARDGQFYRHGETTVTRENNGRLYKCTCLNGQRRCSVTKEDGHVLIADVDKIEKVTLAAGQGFENTFIQHLPGIAVAIDVDIESDFVFWTDVSYQARGIYRARYSDGSRITKIISYEIFEPNGIAVDWLSKNVYWTDAQLGAVFVANYDGRMRSRLISGLTEPRTIILLPREGLMFWSDQSSGTIERSRMDGSDRRIVIAGLVWPNELAIDRLARRIYWIDAYRRRIESCNLNGGSYLKISDYSNTGFNLPGFGLSLFGDHLYFGLWNMTGQQSTLFSITKIGSHFKPIVRTLGRKPMGMTIVNRTMQSLKQNTNPCWSPASGMCTHLCLPTSHNSYRCACPSNTGLVLSRDGRRCIVPDRFLLFTSLVEGTVMMVSTENGANRVPSLFAQSSQPSAVAFDPVDRAVYWSDVALNAIFRKRLGDINSTKFIQDGIGTVDGLAVDYVNRHLYFTNMGWHSSTSPYHQIEMVDLRDAGKRKILTSSLLEKPRDILIDQHYQKCLYVSDWGSEPKVIRLDLDGQSPRVLPIQVENPNGIALNGYNLYVVDSHMKSATMGANGTTIHHRPPTLIKYDTRFHNSSMVDLINIEVPFGLTSGPEQLYMTDWGLKGIYEVSMERSSLREFVVGIEKATGIAEASLRYHRYENGCNRNSRQCSDICVSIATVDYQCMCPDRSGKALSYYNCVLPDTFLLVADESQIVMKSFDPPDDQQYAVVRTFDLLSNIVALTYDPEADFIYWADNGRQRIMRKNFRDKHAQYETLHTYIGRIEGMALDPVHRLLYWTDAERGTIEMISLSRRIHATVRTQLSHPRAIALNPDAGIMYWTEEGDYPMVLSAAMTGQDIKPLITRNLKWPNALYYDDESDLIWVADGGTVEIVSLLAGGEPTILDQRDMNGTARHIYGLWKDPTGGSASMLFSDWKNRAVFKDSQVFMDNLIRPSQIHIQKPYRGPVIYDHCQSTCSHICIPTRDSFACICPDDLTLSNDLRTCITAEQAFLLTSTTEASTTTTTTLPATTTTTQPWAELIVTTEAITVENLNELLDNATTAALPAGTAPTELIVTTAAPTTDQTTAEETTTVQTVAQTTSIPGEPYFVVCDEMNTYEIALPVDSPLVNVTPALLNMKAYDGLERPLAVMIRDDLGERNASFLEIPAENLTVHFQAEDGYGRLVTCDVQLAITDRTPPKVHYCPYDMQVETYSEKGEAFVDWEAPKFVDNYDSVLKVTQTTDPGLFPIGLYNITYTAEDLAGNIAHCIFQLAVLQKESSCQQPHAPHNSQLICRNVEGVQQCRIMCDTHYEMSLADPNIKCETDVDEGKSAWVPFLSAGVCARPLPSNVQQEVYLLYDCPCQSHFSYYERARNMIFRTIKDHSGCRTFRSKLGFCNSRKQGKLQLECIKEKLLNVTLTVDLDNLVGLQDTNQARDVVSQGVNDIVEGALDGKIVAPGHNDKTKYTINEKALQVSKARVQCDVGFRSTDDGCVQCPKGTSLENNECKFCLKNSYQDEAGREHCIQCKQGRGTTIYGATDQRYCVEMKAVEQTPVNLIIAGVVGAVLVLCAAAFLIVFIKRRKRNNKIKKEQEKKKRQQLERRRRRRTRSTESRKSRKSEIAKIERSKSVSKSENGKIKSNGAVRISSVSSADQKTEVIKAPKDQSPNNTEPQQPLENGDVTPANNPPEAEKDREEKNRSEEPDVGRQSPEGGDSAISVEESEVTSAATSEPPLKSALKKPKNLPPPSMYLEEDASTVISTSTINTAQLRRANIKPRSSSVDQDTKSPPHDTELKRGRPTGRSMTMKRQANSASRMFPLPTGQSSSVRRSLSFDRQNGPPPRRSTSQYNIHMVRPPHSQIRPGMPHHPSQIRVPSAPAASFMVGPPAQSRTPIYGTYSPRRMPPPTQAGMYPPGGGARHPLMGVGGPGPHLQRPYGGMWSNQGWEAMAIRNRPDMPPTHMMTFPRQMSQRFMIPGAAPNLRPYPRMQNPPAYCS